jgi:2-polyprenyl-3-methyl-5-hydroxy-6-metoxy-1,4-benzoquinol methylase
LLPVAALTTSCPLCEGLDIQHYYQDINRAYNQCERCGLVYVDGHYRLSPAQEKSEYDLHQNSPDDPAYRAFLSRLFVPMLSQLSPGAKGLDFGCGSGPALSHMLSEAGFDINVYDIYYFKDPSVLQQSYDFVTATELVEHLYEPGKIFRQLWSLLPAGGCLGLMTKLLIDLEAFSNWHYKNDPTHVCFYSRDCFKYIAGMINADLTIIGSDVIILTKL